MKLTHFTLLRISVLLGCLAVVVAISAHQREFTRNWNQAIDVTVFPINADNSVETDTYIRGLTSKDFDIINRWGEREAKRHNLVLSTPFKVKQGQTILCSQDIWRSLMLI